MAIHVVGPGDGERSGGGPIRCRIIEDGSHTRHRLGLIEAVVPPGPGGPPQHIHGEHDEVFIVTQGMLRLSSGTDSFDVPTGACVTVPSGTPHTFSNPVWRVGEVPLHAYPRPLRRVFRDLGRLSTDSNGQLAPAAVGSAMVKYSTDVIR